MAQAINIEEKIGEKYGRLTIIGFDRKEPRIISTTNKQDGWKYYVICKCECGNVCVVNYNNLVRKHTTSCGCFKKEQSSMLSKQNFSTMDGESVGEYKRIYNIYRGMVSRCYNPNCREYKRYGARGIFIAEEWQGKEGFFAFKEWSLSNGYADDLEIDRIDNDSGYAPDNCRWTNRVTQMRNTRRNRLITYNGEQRSMAEWCEILGLDYARTQARLNLGYTPEEAFTANKHQVLHIAETIKHPIVLDGYVFDSIKECCEEYLGQTVGSFSNYLAGHKPMPQKWKDRGLRNYDETSDKELKHWKQTK